MVQRQVSKAKQKFLSLEMGKLYIMVNFTHQKRENAKIDFRVSKVHREL
jgi:hypothetical protein